MQWKNGDNDRGWQAISGDNKMLQAMEPDNR